MKLKKNGKNSDVINWFLKISIKSDKPLLDWLTGERKRKILNYQFREQKRGHDYKFYREKKSGEMIKIRYVNKFESIYEMEKKCFEIKMTKADTRRKGNSK